MTLVNIATQAISCVLASIKPTVADTSVVVLITVAGIFAILDVKFSLSVCKRLLAL
ncbi:MAG: hypothetical protein V7K76_28875 [Nostoc sp.]